jgi:hypothetical protein
LNTFNSPVNEINPTISGIQIFNVIRNNNMAINFPKRTRPKPKKKPPIVIDNILNRKEIERQKKLLVAAEKLVAKLENHLKVIDLSIPHIRARIEQAKTEQERKAAQKDYDDIIEDQRNTNDDLDDAKENVTDIEQRIIDLQTERQADSGSNRENARSYVRALEGLGADPLPGENTPDDPSMHVPKLPLSRRPEPDPDSLHMSSLITPSPVQRAGDIAAIPQNMGVDNLYSRDNKSDLPPLIRLDGQKLKKSEAVYPSLAYRENVHQAWPEWAIENVAKRYPNQPAKIEASRHLVPDNPLDLQDPDYFDLPENPTFMDQHRHGIWQNKKRGGL